MTTYPRSGLRGTACGISGILKQEPADFLVEEIPAYEPSGEGDHLFLRIEKRGLSGEQLTTIIRHALGVNGRDIGVAGIKDRHAITRQYVSVPASFEDRLDLIRDDRIRVLEARRHQNKLRRGHLRGNRFSILLRQTNPGALEVARPLGQAICRHGFPNYFGSQRFGPRGETWKTGLALLTGAKQPRELPRSRKRFLLSLTLSAVQSYLFNLALAERIQRGRLFRVLAGDVMQVVESGGKFVVDDPAREQQRFDAGEIVTTGPMFGKKMKHAIQEPGQLEEALLKKLDLTLEHFLRFPKLTLGTRRPYLVRPSEWSVDEQDDGLRFSFILPSGSYATVLLAEFLEEGISIPT